ncbi:MAG: ABC transporter permease subunit [Alphaproteobacteria bacterium]|nr:ABC transporter permease subunit [Alphaproteobacteria bacterium]
MRTIWAIFRREFAGYFDSALAYIVIPVFLLLVGVFSLWFNDIFATGLATMRVVHFWSAMFLVLLIPAVTMRLFAEEHRTGSLELLATLPVTERQLVLGKYSAAVALILVALGLTLPYAITLSRLGELDWGPVIGGYLGLALLAAAYTAIGTAASTVTSNQIVAFLLAMAICMVPYVTGFFLHRVPGDLLPLVQYLSFDYHFNGMARGVIDSRSLVFYATVDALALHVAVFALEQRRLS